MARPHNQPRPTVEKMGVRPRRAGLSANELALIAEAYELTREGVVAWREQPRLRSVLPRCHLCRRELRFEHEYSRDENGDYYCLDHPGCNVRARARLFRRQSRSLRRRAERITSRLTDP